ncbi:uncharacterized protein F5891DRAFT_980458 [Suillus fuscotomentosus]|uniref:Uncharacterized protein n=1 Tax=Suillus fuscotomentosus TaxID=1912939 RepID=A0AAD4HL49_9AGAM|nr:uncharacterized protein F5891DRAFT_980458 [Suillus fuscotomentosus]KAG1900176.1 hypothetical protein F5891DRAFT_980458 [Suillus fuscotomentosus]
MTENDCEGNPSPPVPVVSLCVSTSPQARAKRKIAALMEEVEILKQDKATKQRKTIYYVSQGRALRRMVVLYTPIEDLVAENDRRCEDMDGGNTIEQNRLQRRYIELAKVLPWFHEKLAGLDFEESEDMLRKLKRGADSARGDDTGTLKELVASWVNIECRPDSLIRNRRQAPSRIHYSAQRNGAGRTQCKDSPRHSGVTDVLSSVKAGIRDRTTTFIVSENSWPSFMYENYEADIENLECGLFKSRLLVMGFKAIFTSPSSANEVDGDGDGADIIENNRRARRRSDHARVKTCVASIIGMRKATPRAIAYTACQIRFALSNITSWRTVDADFDYQILFEDPPGPAALARVNKLLDWWTRKIFGRNHRQDLTSDVVKHMSVNSLAAQRQQMEDASFDSD